MFIVHCSIAIYGVPAGQSDSDCIPSISREEWTANSIRRLERPSQGKRSVPRDNSCARVAGVAPRELEISRPHRGARPILSVARQPPRRVSLGLGVCDSLRRVRNNTPVCPETYRHDPPGRDIILGLVVVLWHPPGDLELEIITTHKDRVSSSGAAYFVAGRHLSDNLYWVAVSRALSSASTSASVDSRRYGVLALYCTKPALSSTPLGIGTNRCHWRSGRAGDRLSKHGVLAA